MPLPIWKVRFRLVAMATLLINCLPEDVKVRRMDRPKAQLFGTATCPQCIQKEVNDCSSLPDLSAVDRIGTSVNASRTMSNPGEGLRHRHD